MQLFSVVLISSFLVFGIMQLLGDYKTPFYIIARGFEFFKVLAWIYGLSVLGFAYYMNNYYYTETLIFYMSKGKIKFGNKNKAVNWILLLNVIVCPILILSGVYRYISC